MIATNGWAAEQHAVTHSAFAHLKAHHVAAPAVGATFLSAVIIVAQETGVAAQVSLRAVLLQRVSLTGGVARQITRAVLQTP